VKYGTSMPNQGKKVIPSSEFPNLRKLGKGKKLRKGFPIRRNLVN